MPDPPDPPTPTPVPIPSALPIFYPSNSHPHHHLGAILGGVLGGVASIVAILVLALWAHRLRRSQSRNPPPSSDVPSKGEPKRQSTQPSSVVSPTIQGDPSNSSANRMSLPSSHDTSMIYNDPSKMMYNSSAPYTNQPSQSRHASALYPNRIQQAGDEYRLSTLSGQPSNSALLPLPTQTSPGR